MSLGQERGQRHAFRDDAFQWDLLSDLLIFMTDARRRKFVICFDYTKDSKWTWDVLLNPFRNFSALTFY